MTQSEHRQPFNLLRWFAWLSPFVIAGIALVNAWILSNFLNSHLFQREASVSRDFVQNILLADGSLDYLVRPDDSTLALRFRNTVDHLSKMRDVLRANVFSSDRTILWSSDVQLIGKRFRDNEELDEAMSGELVVHSGTISDAVHQKPEHMGLDPKIRFFVESYIPVTRPSDGTVVGVVELYKAPLALTEAVQEGRRQVLLSAMVSALALYLSLFWMIRRADSTIKRQHTRLIEAETLAVVGELTSSVAHNIRNPLSSIRSSAELALESPTEDCTEQARDIIREVDRISERITELLSFSGKDAKHTSPLDLDALLRQCVADHQAAFERRLQSVSYESSATRAMIDGDATLLRQVLHSLLANAAEAMSEGGKCSVGLSQVGKGGWRIDIADSGSGIPPGVRKQIFRPFFTTKPKGLGLGLPLARRIVERFGGSIDLSSVPGSGSTVTIIFPVN